MLGILAVTLLWIPIAVSGLPKTSLFSMHWVNMIDIGILTDEPSSRYGLKNQIWNETNIADGYVVESYNFTNIPKVIGVEFEFQALITKVEDGRTNYQGLSPTYRDVKPFNGLNFQYSGFAIKNITAMWQNNTALLDADTLPYSISKWDEAIWQFESEIFVSLKNVTQIIPSTEQVMVTSQANWTFALTLSAPGADLSEYHIGFNRSASVDLTMLNDTALSASGKYTVMTGDTEAVSITYRSLPLALATYVALGLAAASMIAVVVMFRRNISQFLSRFVSRRRQEPVGTT